MSSETSHALAFTVLPTVSQNPNPNVPLAAIVTFTANRAVETVIAITDGVNAWETHFDMDAQPETGLGVIGFRPDRQHTLHITIRDVDGETTTSAPLIYTSPPLPDDVRLFPPMHVTVSQPERMEPGLTLVMARRRIPGEPTELTPEQRAFNINYGLMILLDAQGEVVWYLQTQARVADAIRLHNGNFLYLTTDFRLTEVDPLGNERQAWYASHRPQGSDDTAIPIEAQTLHHCIYELANGNFMAFTANAQEVPDFYTSEWDPNAPRQTQMVMGDTIIEFTREGEVVWRWNCFDYLDPYRIGYETLYTYWWVRGFPGQAGWTHGNSMWIDEEANTLLLCLRCQEAILKIDRHTGNIQWILGEPTDWPEALQSKLLKPIGPVQWPYHMHSPSITGDGIFLIFDNGLFQARPFTPPKAPAETYGRAAAYAIDEANLTVREVWASDTFGPDNMISYAMGDADWLPKTGNVLISYGLGLRRNQVTDIKNTQWNACTHHRPSTRIREVTRTTPPDIVFEVGLRNDAEEPNIGWVCFGAERLEGL